MTIEDKGYFVTERHFHSSNQVMKPSELVPVRIYKWFQGLDNSELIEIVSKPIKGEIWIKRFRKNKKKKKQINEIIESARLSDMGIVPYDFGTEELWHKLNYIVP